MASIRLFTLRVVTNVVAQRCVLQEEEAAIAALLGEEVDTSSILAAAAALPDLSEDVAEAAADAAARGGPLADAAVQVSPKALFTVHPYRLWVSRATATEWPRALPYGIVVLSLLPHVGSCNADAGGLSGSATPPCLPGSCNADSRCLCVFSLCLQEYLAALAAVDASAGLTDAATVEQLLKAGGEVEANAGPSADLGAAPAAPDVSATLAAEVSCALLLDLRVSAEELV
jgi:hypothetical protein